MWTLLAATAFALTWLPSLDLIVPIFDALDADHRPVYGLDRLGFDRDTGTTSRLYVADRCYTAWRWSPTPGQGAIVSLVQIDPRQWVLVHESGALRVEPQPESLVCVPLSK